MTTRWDVHDEPRDVDLVRIDAEWPLIEAEMNLLDAEVARLVDGDGDLARRRVRRAEALVLARAHAWAGAAHLLLTTEGPVAA